MASQEYRFPHDLGLDLARERVQPLLDHLVGNYGLAIESPGPDRWRLHRPGVDARVEVEAHEIRLTVDLTWFLEKTLRVKIDDALAEKLPPLLR